MKKDTSKKPFFARLLEKQELDAVTGGGTLKYPSDSEKERADFDFEVSSIKKPPYETTQKAPSDSDESAL